MVVPEHVNDADMVLLARDIAKQIEAELEYPGQIKVNVIRESRAIDYAKDLSTPLNWFVKSSSCFRRLV